VQLEEAVRQLPVPASQGARSVLINRLLNEENPAPQRQRPSVAMILGSWILDPRDSPQRRVGAGLVAGIAAALLLFLTGWWIFFHLQPSRQSDTLPVAVKKPAVDPLVADLMRYNIILAKATTPRERVEAMASVAEELNQRSRQLAKKAPPDDLKLLAGLYGRVVHEGILARAEALPRQDRRPVLEPIASQLEKVESQARQMSEQPDLSPQAAQWLALISRDAGEGGKNLRKLVQEAGL
jgi:hypothetical protein